jgi:predicted transcriptional regulator
MKRRERSEIIHDILLAIREKGVAKPTHILYKSNLSSKMLAEYLDELLEKEFIEERSDKKGKKSYLLIERGFNYLKDFSVIQSFMDSYGLG